LSLESSAFLTSDNVVVLIPARGGSKGIPRKNLQTVGGVSLVARSIRASRATQCDWPIFVSTDSSEIAAVATSEGATVINRPADVSTDIAASEEAISHFLDSVGLTDGSLIMIQPTSPFLNGDDLVKLAALRGEFDSGLTVCESHLFIWKGRHNSTLVGVNHDPAIRKRRQELTNQEFFENGAAYFMDIAGFLQCRHRFFGRIGYVTMPRRRSIEIDDPDDLLLAEQINSILAS